MVPTYNVANGKTWVRHVGQLAKDGICQHQID